MITEILINVEIGKIYSVPCVKGGRSGVNLPVLPFHHKDVVFGESSPANQPHYHIDMRFLSESTIKYLKRFGYNFSNDLTRIVNIATVNSEPFYRRLKCHRKHTGIYSFDSISIDMQAIAFEWYHSMNGTSCKGKLCPHYNVPMFENQKGNLECPFHGLIGDKQSEIIIGNCHNNKELI